MKAILFRYSRRSSTFAYLLGAVVPRAYLAAPGPLALEEIPEPELPGTARLIGDRFRLDQYRDALLVGRQKLRHRAVKVVFDFPYRWPFRSARRRCRPEGRRYKAVTNEMPKVLAL